MATLQRLLRHVFLPSLVGLLVLASATSARAQLGGISYSLSPEVVRMQWDDDAALANDYMYGGTFGLGFGQYLRVGGVYFTGPNIDTDFEELTEFGGIPESEVDLKRYGGQLHLNLSRQELIPYLSVGAGILEFDPDGANTYESIYATVGAGLTFSVADRYNLSVGGELLSYRYDPVELFFDDPPDVTVDEQTVLSPSLSAALALHVGGRSPDEMSDLDREIQGQFRRGLGGVRVIAEPFYGRLNFNDALNFPKDQNLYGINAGTQLGPYIGIRGFYWRGSEGADFGDRFAEGFEDISMYGGELQLMLNPAYGEGIIPYVLLGGGQLDVISGYEEDIPSGTAPPEDRLFASGGAGVEVPLTNSIRLMGGVRSLLMSNDEAEDVSEPGQVFGSWMYTAGVTLSLGGGPDPTPGDLGEDRPMVEPRADVPEETADQPAAAMERQPSAEENALMTRIDSLEQRMGRHRAMMQQRLDALTQARTEAAEAPATRTPRDRPTSGAARTARPAGMDTAGRLSNLSQHTMAVPVPEVGEVYLRIGDTRQTAGETPAQPEGEAPRMSQPVIFSALPGQEGETGEALSAADVEEIIRRAVREQMQGQGRADTATGLTEAQIEQSVRETVDELMAQAAETDEQAAARSAAEVQRLENEIEELRGRLEQQDETITELREGAAAPPQETEQEQAPVEEPAPAEEQVQGGTSLQTVLGRTFMGADTFTGFRAGAGSAQLQLGIRGDYRTDASSRVRILPELSMGFGNGTTLALLANVGYTFGEDYVATQLDLPLLPYAGIGVGLASHPDEDTEFVGNLFLGADYEFNGGSFFTEYGTLDLFDVHRFHVGYRLQL